MPYRNELTMADATSSPSSIKLTTLVGVAAAFGIFVVVGWYSSRMTNDYPSWDHARGEARYATLAKVRADANQTLSTAAWVDQGKGTVRIPIQEAMTEEVAALQAKAPSMGQVIPGTTPPPAPAPAPATNAAPAATAPAKPKP